LFLGNFVTKGTILAFFIDFLFKFTYDKGNNDPYFFNYPQTVSFCPLFVNIALTMTGLPIRYLDSIDNCL